MEIMHNEDTAKEQVQVSHKRGMNFPKVVTGKDDVWTRCRSVPLWKDLRGNMERSFVSPGQIHLVVSGEGQPHTWAPAAPAWQELISGSFILCPLKKLCV